MRKWFLLAIVAILTWFALSYREGANETLTPAPRCTKSGMTVIDGWCKKPDVSARPPVCPGGSTFSAGKCRGSDSMTAAQAAAGGFTYDSFVNQYVKPAASTCPAGYTKSVGNMCEDTDKTLPVCSTGYTYNAQQGKCQKESGAPLDTFDDNAMLVCNRYWDSAISSWASGAAASPATAAEQCKKYAPSWIMMSMAAGTLTTGSGKPTDSTKRQAIIEKKQAVEYAADTASAKAYSSSTGYAALAAQAKSADGGPPPSSMNATARPMDAEVTRSSVGTVFGESGPFSGRPGGGASAAATLTGSTPATGGRSDPYGLPATKGGAFLSGGSSLPVDGPNWGGMGKPTTASISRGSQPGPVLYGPAGTKVANNSGNRYTLPSFGSSGSEPWNKYAATSRAPGDKDPFGAAYDQAASYSLGNTLQKTNPVPYLTDFSAFLK
jgi:hypothetical protein